MITLPSASEQKPKLQAQSSLRDLRGEATSRKGLHYFQESGDRGWAWTRAPPCLLSREAILSKQAVHPSAKLTLAIQKPGAGCWGGGEDREERGAGRVVLEVELV